MSRVFIITINLLLSIVMISLIDWFKQEEIKIDSMKRTYNQDIQKLQKITQINSWLKSDIIPNMEIKNSTSQEVDENFIKFFDENRDRYNLIIKRYIYTDEMSKNMDLSYTFSTSSRDIFDDFIHLKVMDGFVQFRELTIDNGAISGKFQIAQPYYGDR